MTRGILKSAMDDLALRVTRGESLSSALRAHAHLFSPVYVGMVRAGERSGDLSGAFQRLAEHLERASELRSRLVSASIYPLLLLFAATIAVVMLFAFVMPRFIDLIETTQSELPRSTAALFAVSAVLREHGILLLAALIGAVCMIALYARTERGRRAISSATFALPGLGLLRRHVEGGRFARLAGVLVAGGAPLYSALGDIAAAIDDPLVREEVVRIRARVRAGAAFHRTVSESPMFPPLLAQLVAVGEESGRLGDFLVKAADILETRTHRTLERLVTLAEPLMILFLGSLIGLVALSLLQAVYGVNAGAL